MFLQQSPRENIQINRGLKALQTVVTFDRKRPIISQKSENYRCLFSAKIWNLEYQCFLHLAQTLPLHFKVVHETLQNEYREGQLHLFIQILLPV